MKKSKNKKAKKAKSKVKAQKGKKAKKIKTKKTAKKAKPKKVKAKPKIKKVKKSAKVSSPSKAKMAKKESAPKSTPIAVQSATQPITENIAAINSPANGVNPTASKEWKEELAKEEGDVFEEVDENFKGFDNFYEEGSGEVEEDDEEEGQQF